MQKIMIFVYGTLKQGQRNHGILGQVPVRSASTRGQLYLMPHGYPAMVLGTGVVHGELVEISQEVLERLDILEGVAHGLYSRQLIQIEEPAWVYTMTLEQVLRRGGVPVPKYP